MKRISWICLTGLLFLTLAGCHSWDRRTTGAVVGAGAGGLVGAAIGKTPGAIIGAAGGAVVGSQVAKKKKKK